MNVGDPADHSEAATTAFTWLAVWEALHRHPLARWARLTSVWCRGGEARRVTKIRVEWAEVFDQPRIGSSSEPRNPHFLINVLGGDVPCRKNTRDARRPR